MDKRFRAAIIGVLVGTAVVAAAPQEGYRFTTVFVEAIDGRANNGFFGYVRDTSVAAPVCFSVLYNRHREPLSHQVVDDIHCRHLR